MLIRRHPRHIRPNPLLIITTRHSPQHVLNINTNRRLFFHNQMNIPLIRKLRIRQQRLPPPRQISLPSHRPNTLLTPNRQRPRLNRLGTQFNRRTLRLKHIIRRHLMLVINTRIRRTLSTNTIMPQPIRRRSLTINQGILGMTLRMPLPRFNTQQLNRNRRTDNTKIRVLSRPFSNTTLTNHIASFRRSSILRIIILTMMLRLRRLSL